ncbi:MAG: OmpH family outer membrane protein [Gammaproteobacteria bacterium]|nr:OmpH family outer membrane protein [Gammaproteobacteria bacterium]
MKKIILGLVTGILMSTAAIAETIAVVNVQLIASKIPQAAAMQQTLQQEFAGPTEEVKKLESDIKFNIEKFQRESMTMSDEQKTELQTKVAELQQAYQAKLQPLEQQMRRRQAEERNKILALIQQAVQVVAADEKVDIVLDANAVAYVKPELDLSEKVIEKVTKLN